MKLNFLFYRLFLTTDTEFSSFVQELPKSECFFLPFQFLCPTSGTSPGPHILHSLAASPASEYTMSLPLSCAPSSVPLVDNCLQPFHPKTIACHPVSYPCWSQIDSEPKIIPEVNSTDINTGDLTLCFPFKHDFKKFQSCVYFQNIFSLKSMKAKAHSFPLSNTYSLHPEAAASIKISFLKSKQAHCFHSLLAFPLITDLLR